MSKDTRKGLIVKFLGVIEVVGNKLPNPVTLFAYFALFTIVVSGIVSLFDFSVKHPATGNDIVPFSLFSIEGLHYILTSMISNFTSFAPLGTVLVSMLGIGIADASGLMQVAIRLLVLSSPKRLLTFIVVFAGVMSNTAGEVGYVLLIPLSAIIFNAVGRHPIAGIAAAFAGVSGGYSANLLLGTIDPLLAGLSTEAAHIIDKSYVVNPAANYYFLFVSTFLVSIIGTVITEKITVPRLGRYSGGEVAEELKPLTNNEKRGLQYAIGAMVVFTAILLWGLLPAEGFLRDPKTFDVLKSPFMSGIVAFIFFGGALVGIAYGFGAGTFKKESDVIKGMNKSMEMMGSYLVLVFFAAQFVAYFNKTNLGMILAVQGSEFLKSLDLGAIPLMLSFIIVTALVNLVIGSASAKWALLAPIFIPMFMLLGYSPEMTQAAYRIGDSVSNIVSPMMSYFALIITFIHRYDKESGVGTLIATMLPYTIALFIAWSLLFVVWYLLGLPLGPGADLFYTS